jgi:hypothetical protein
MARPAASPRREGVRACPPLRMPAAGKGRRSSAVSCAVCGRGRAGGARGRGGRGEGCRSSSGECRSWRCARAANLSGEEEMPARCMRAACGGERGVGITSLVQPTAADAFRLSIESHRHLHTSPQSSPTVSAFFNPSRGLVVDFVCSHPR